MELSTETARLDEAQRRLKHWKRWGPYLSERAWGTVREDYSPGGTAWDYFRTITRGRASIDGKRTALPASATGTSVSASPLRYGTAAIPSSRSACSV